MPTSLRTIRRWHALRGRLPRIEEYPWIAPAYRLTEEPMSESTALANVDESVESVLHRLKQIQELMQRAMVKDTDYGPIPGTNGRPVLLQPGAQKLCLMFHFAPSYQTTKTYHQDGHLTVESSCSLAGPDGRLLGEANAICSTRESKYAYRKAARKCPLCEKETIIKGKDEFGGGWVCWKKKGGCGHQFPDGDKSIESQAEGRIPNENLADAYNTVLRMAEKRAYVAAVRLVTGSSCMFDEEITGGNDGEAPKQPAKEEPKTAESQAVKQWREWLDRSPALDAFNENLRDFEELDEADKPTVAKLIGDYAKRRGWRGDKATRTYYAPQAEKVQP